MQTLLVIFSALIASIALGPEATIPMLSDVGVDGRGYVIIYGITFSLTLILAFLWLDIIQPCLAWADKFFCRYWLWRWAYSKFIAFINRPNSRQEKSGGMIVLVPSYFFMGALHLYIVGEIFIMFKPNSSRKFILGLVLLAGAITRLIIVATLWSYVQGISWIISEVVQFGVQAYIACVVCLWLFNRAKNLRWFQKEEIPIAAS